LIWVDKIDTGVTALIYVNIVIHQVIKTRAPIQRARVERGFCDPLYALVDSILSDFILLAPIYVTVEEILLI